MSTATKPPSCGARTRTGTPCDEPGMPNGRCRVHGGTSTGPRTPEGMARMIAAKTTHGMHGAAGAERRARRVFVRTSIVRVRLQTTAIELEAYLPPEMAVRLHRIPPELQPPPHLSHQATWKFWFE